MPIRIRGAGQQPINAVIIGVGGRGGGAGVNFLEAAKTVGVEAKIVAVADIYADQAKGGLLRGVPIGVKDIIDTHDMPTGHNSPIFEGTQPFGDAADLGPGAGEHGLREAHHLQTVPALEGGGGRDFARDFLDGPLGRRPRGRGVLPRETPAALHAPAKRRHAGVLPVGGGAAVSLSTPR